MATHAGIVHVLDLQGTRLKSYKRHNASIVDISLDTTADFVATASIDGQSYLALKEIRCSCVPLRRTGRYPLFIDP